VPPDTTALLDRLLNQQREINSLSGHVQRYRDQAARYRKERNALAKGQVRDVIDSRPLVQFLYLLARDLITTGAAERVLAEVAQDGAAYQFSNGWLARWAQEAAARLEGDSDIHESE